MVKQQDATPWLSVSYIMQQHQQRNSSGQQESGHHLCPVHHPLQLQTTSTTGAHPWPYAHVLMPSGNWQLSHSCRFLDTVTEALSITWWCLVPQAPTRTTAPPPSHGLPLLPWPSVQGVCRLPYCAWWHPSGAAVCGGQYADRASAEMHLLETPLQEAATPCYWFK
jgi:hypothetical protein